MWNSRLFNGLCWNKSNTSSMPRLVASLPIMCRKSSFFFQKFFNNSNKYIFHQLPETIARSLVLASILVISLTSLLLSWCFSARRPLGHNRFLQKQNKYLFKQIDQSSKKNKDIHRKFFKYLAKYSSLSWSAMCSLIFLFIESPLKFFMNVFTINMSDWRIHWFFSFRSNTSSISTSKTLTGKLFDCWRKKK